MLLLGFFILCNIPLFQSAILLHCSFFKSEFFHNCVNPCTLKKKLSAVVICFLEFTESLAGPAKRSFSCKCLTCFSFNDCFISPKANISHFFTFMLNVPWTPRRLNCLTVQISILVSHSSIALTLMYHAVSGGHFIRNKITLYCHCTVIASTIAQRNWKLAHVGTKHNTTLKWLFLKCKKGMSKKRNNLINKKKNECPGRQPGQVSC